MAELEFFQDLNGSGVVQLKGMRIHNIADAAAQSAFEGNGNFGSALDSSNKGLIIYRSDLSRIAVWDGVKFVFQEIEIEGDIQFKGTFDASKAVDDASQPQPIVAKAGYQYVVSVAGTFAAGASGVTLIGNQDLQVGDQILFTSATEAYAIQRNDVYASETVEGNIRLATQAEVNAGAVADEAVTPATLHQKLVGQAYVKQYAATVTLSAGTPFTVSHGLNLIDRNSFTINVIRNNSIISVDVDSVDANSLTLTSLVPLSGVRVVVQGASAA